VLEERDSVEAMEGIFAVGLTVDRDFLETGEEGQKSGESEKKGTLAAGGEHVGKARRWRVRSVLSGNSLWAGEGRNLCSEGRTRLI